MSPTHQKQRVHEALAPWHGSGTRGRVARGSGCLLPAGESGTGATRAALTCHSAPRTADTQGLLSPGGMNTQEGWPRVQRWMPQRQVSPRAVVKDGEPLTESLGVRARAGHPSWGEGGCPLGWRKGQARCRGEAGCPGWPEQTRGSFQGRGAFQAAPSHGASVPAPCFLGPGWPWRCKQAGPQCWWPGGPWGVGQWPPLLWSP